MALPISTITFWDWIVLSIMGSLIGVYSVWKYYNSRESELCKEIKIKPNQLVIWRYFLYLNFLSVLIILIFTFIVPQYLRFFFYLPLILMVIKMLDISLPTWFCKLKFKVFYCNCEYYMYRDFYPVILIGTVVVLILLIFEFGLLEFLVPGLGLCAVSLLYFFPPKKKLQPLNFRSEYLINSIEDLQEFIQNGGKKLIILIHNGCEFCSLQLDEINLLPEKLIMNIRIIDYSMELSLNQFVYDFLNIKKEKEGIDFPSTLKIENGMYVETKEGIVVADEIRSELSNPDFSTDESLE